MEGSWPNEEPVPDDGAVNNIDEEDEDEEDEWVQMGGEQDAAINNIDEENEDEEDEGVGMGEREDQEEQEDQEEEDVEDEEGDEEEEEEEDDEDEDEEEEADGEEEPDNNDNDDAAEDEDADDEEEDGEDEDGEDEEDAERNVYDWGFLPEVCLRSVFWWLRDRDRVRADLVCHYWHSVMRSPSLWRSRSFHLSGRLSKFRRSEPHTTLTYARYLGGYLEKLEVCVCPPHSSLVARRLQHTLRGLLDELTRAGARLQSFSLTGLELDRSCWPRGVRGSLVRCLALFLRRVTSQLASVSLKGARTSLTQGLELLSALCLSQQHLYLRGRPGVSSLDLEDFFSAPLCVHLHPTLPRALHSLRGLTSLALSYSCLSDELLLALGQGGWGRGRTGRGYGWGREGGALRSLALRCHVNEPHAQVVCGGPWASLAKSCPELSVLLHVERVVNTDRLSRVLLPEMPLTEYSMTSCYFSQQDWSAKPVLSTMLPQYKHRLQRLTMDLNNCHESLDEELVALVQMCVRLQYLKVWAFLDISTVEKLLLNRLEKRSSLNSIRVRIYSVQDETQEEEEQLEELLSRYTHLASDLHLSAIIYPII